MQIYNLITIIIVLTAVFGYINFRFIKLPDTIGIMIISLIASLAVVGIGLFYPHFFVKITDYISKIDFNTALMRIMRQVYTIRYGVCSTLLFIGTVNEPGQQQSRRNMPYLRRSLRGMR